MQAAFDVVQSKAYDFQQLALDASCSVLTQACLQLQMPMIKARHVCCAVDIRQHCKKMCNHLLCSSSTRAPDMLYCKHISDSTHCLFHHLSLLTHLHIKSRSVSTLSNVAAFGCLAFLLLSLNVTACCHDACHLLP